MKKIIPLFLLLNLSINTTSAWAVGEDDPLWNKPSYEKKVINIGRKLLEANGITENITFQVGHRRINEKSNINATAEEWYATVTVEDGLLKLIESDDELAFVIGHEIAHITQRHGSRERSGSRARGLLIMLPLVAAGALTGPLGAAAAVPAATVLGPRINQAFTNKQSRNHETDSDLIGLEYMAKAGYDPRKSISIAQKIFGDGSRHTIWRDHPAGSERIQALTMAISRIQTTMPNQQATAETESVQIQATSAQPKSEAPNISDHLQKYLLNPTQTPAQTKPPSANPTISEAKQPPKQIEPTQEQALPQAATQPASVQEKSSVPDYLEKYLDTNKAAAEPAKATSSDAPATDSNPKTITPTKATSPSAKKPNAVNKDEALKALEALKNQGLLTVGEYERKKNRLLKK